MQSFMPVQTISIHAFADSIETVIEGIEEGPVELQEQGRPVAVLVSSALYEAILNQLDDLDLATLVHLRRHEVGVSIELDQL